MIQVRDLVKRYGDKAALNGVSFGIGAGEVVGLLGLNGAGKSTTMNILTGYLHMDSGSVKVGGFDLLSQPLKAKAQVGYMPEQPAFYGNMRVREYLNFICDLRGAARTRAARRLHVDDICARVGLEGMQNRLVRNLSKGYRQRVSFAQALAGDPKVLILDEPTVGLDPSQIQDIRALVRNLGKERTVLISSHILSEISELCSRVLVLKEGTLVADDSPRSLAARTRQAHKARLRVQAGFEQAKAALEQAPGNPRIDSQGTLEEGTVELAFTLDRGLDARVEAFKALAKAGLPLLYTYGAEPSLEDIFLHLVGRAGEEEA